MWWHRHKWKISSVELHGINCGNEIYAFGSTNVLYVCESCDEVKTKYLSGRWTLEQLTGNKNIAALEKSLGIK